MNTAELEKYGFSLQGELRETGYAVTYRAVQHSLGRNVELRLLKPVYEERPDVIEYFLDIGRLLAHAKSEKVVSVFDIINAPGCRCIVTETVPDATLQEELDAGARFTRKEAGALVLQTAQGVAFLWSKFNLVLHDLSAASVRRDPVSGVKITEFEQAERMEPGMGMMPGDDLAGLAGLLRSLCADAEGTVPEDVEAVAQRLLSQDPDVRFQNWDAVLETLRGLSAGDGAPKPQYRIRQTAQAAANTARCPEAGIFAEDERRRRKDLHRRQAFLWILLFAWFAVLFWFRSSPPQTNPGRSAPAPVREAKEQAEETPATGFPSRRDAAGKTAAAESAPVAETRVESKPEAPDARAIDAQRKLVALFLDRGLHEAAKAAGADAALPARFKAVFRNVPTQQELLRKHMEPKIGKEIPLRHSGKDYNVKLVAVNSASLSLESKGRRVEIPFAKLGIEEKIGWIGRVDAPEDALAVCELLLSIGRKKEAIDLLFQNPFFRPFVEVP